MDALRQWIEQDTVRLRNDGKAQLVEQFEAFVTAFFDARYDAVLAALPGLYRLSDAFNEPVWRLLITYYDALVTVNWKGDLAAALDMLTLAQVDAVRYQHRAAVLDLYLRESLLYAWLDIDAPGYAPMTAAAVRKTLPDLVHRDLRARFQLIDAHCTYHLGDPQKAADLVQDALSEVDWPRAYKSLLQGSALAWLGRSDAARGYIEAAVSGFGESGLLYECNEARLALSELLLLEGDVEGSVQEAEHALMKAGELSNHAHIGRGLGILGEGLVYRAMSAEGLGCFTVALETLDGLGWLRTEAEITLARLEVCQQRSIPPHRDLCELAFLHAERAVYRLRSTDLHARLNAIRE